MQTEGSASVVVPAIDAPSSLACVRSLHRHGYDPIVVSDRRTASVSKSRYCEKTVIAPSPHEDLVAYKDALVELAAESTVLTVIPVREEDIYVLAKYKSEFQEHISTPWPSLDTLQQVQDRVALFDIANQVGVPAPETELLSEERNWDAAKIIKARYTLLADEYIKTYAPEKCREPPGTSYVEPGADESIERIQEEMGHTPLVQDFIPDTNEYAYFALYDQGEAVASFQHRQIRAYNYAGGPSAYRESIRIAALERAGRTLLNELDWHGLAMVEFLRDESTGEFKLMEINPRFWSSLPFTVQAGVDFPHYYSMLAADDQRTINAEYETGLAGHLFRGELLYLHSVARYENSLVDQPDISGAIWEVLSSLYQHPRFDILSREDPRPFIQDMVNAGQEIIK